MNKWALLIGIDRYPLLGAAQQLAGCVNDVQVMAALLRDKFGFPAANISSLLDEQATRQAILDTLDRLIDAQLEPEDVVVIHYSGHGSQMVTSAADELDRLNETIVPADSGRPAPNRDISDDEIHTRLQRLAEKTAAITLIFDSCHSGSITRDPASAIARQIEPAAAPAERAPAQAQEAGPSGWLPLNLRYTLLAGCRDDELSFEYSAGTTRHGALTYFLSQELAQATPGSTYRAIFERAAQQLNARFARQHPQLEGAGDRQLFGVRDIVPGQSVEVLVRDGARAQLGAGAALGLTPGSQWAIYPAGTINAEGADRLGLVEISSVGSVTAQARVVEEQGAIVAGCRAFEEAHDYGEMRGRVALIVPAGRDDGAEILRLIGKSAPLVRTEAEGADYRLYLLDPRPAAAPTDPVPQLGAINEMIWAAVGPDGTLVMPSHAASEADCAEIVVGNLELLTRYRLALTLTNHNRQNPLAGKVAMRLLRQKADESWVEAAPDSGGQIVFGEGDRVALEVTNRGSRRVWLNILDFGLSGAISVLHPFGTQNDPLPPGETLQLGTSDDFVMRLALPPNILFSPAGGVETFKLFVTSAPADFRPLVQQGVRDPAQKAPLWRLLGMAITGSGTRGAIKSALPAADDWLTLECPFVLRPRP